MDQDRSARVKTIVEMLRRHIRDAEARRFERIDSEEETRDASPAPGPSTNPQQPATTNRKRSKTGDGTRDSSESDQEERDVDPTPGTSTDNVQPRVKRKRSKDPSSRSTTTLSSSNMLDTNRNDFSSTSATTVFEDDRLKAFCQKKRSHRYTKHGINGIVYRIWFAPKQNVPLLVVSLTSMFKQVIKYVLEKLQQAFSEEENRQIYMTFSAEGINHELNTGNFSLHTDVRVILDILMEIMSNYFRSNQALELNQGVELRVKLLSLEHVDHKVATQGFVPQVPINQEAGAGDFQMFPWEFNVQSDFNDLRFKDNCLVSSVTAAFFLEQFLNKTDLKTWGTIRFLHSLTLKRRQRAQILLKEKSIEIANRLNISFGGPQKVEVFGDVAAVLEMNIVVHGSHGILYMFPTTYAPQQPILNLFLRPDGVDCIAHISVIKYMSLFEKTMKKRCYFCRSVFHYRSTHSCEKSKPCLKCKRPILLEDYFNGPSMKNTYCPSTLTESNWELKCQHCGQEFQSRNCLEVHTKSCRHTLYFTCCNRQLRVRGKSPIELRAIHDCSKNFCPSPEIVQRGNKEDHWCEERQQDKMLISCAEYFHLKRVEEAHQKCQRKIEDKKKQ